MPTTAGGANVWDPVLSMQTQSAFLSPLQSRLLSIALVFSVLCVPAIVHAEALPQFVGRFEQVADGMRFGWPGSALEFAFIGSSLTVELSDEGRNSFVVNVDGQTTKLNLQKGRHFYTLARGLVRGRHDVEFVRRTEGFLGPTTYHGASTDGTFLVVPRRQRRMLVIGDSISAGYGIEGASATCPFSPDTENQYLTYAAVAARTFDADLTTLAWSGYGLVQNFDGDRHETMGSIWTRAIPTDPASGVPKDGPFDVVIINLGTNDFADEHPDPGFGMAYRVFLRHIRETYPQAFIYATVGPMMSGQLLEVAAKTIRSAVEKVKASGDSRIEFLMFDLLREDEEGCNRHPDVAAHRRMASRLEDAIEGDLNWERH